MAQRVEVVLIDDMDGSDATETVSFSLDGATYEIDLNEANADALRASVGMYIDKARKASGRRASRRTRARR
jgi:hypothetical protein